MKEDFHCFRVPIRNISASYKQLYIESKIGMGHFHIGKNYDLVPLSIIFSLGQYKYHFFPQRDVEMPFPLEMSRFHPFNKSIKNHQILKKK